MSSLYKLLSAICISYSFYKLFKFIVEITQKTHSHIPNVIKKRSERAKITLTFPKDIFFKNKDGLYIFWRRWLPQGEVKAVVTLVHGLKEHCGRYEHVAKAFNSIGVAVYALDHQGHGRSEGDRFHAKCIDDLVDDVMFLSLNARKLHPGVKNFIFGHSMGGNIATVTIIKNQKMFDGAILSAPSLYIDPKETPKLMIDVGLVVSKFVPKLRAIAVPIDTLVKDKQVFDAFVNDPMVLSGVAATLGLQAALLRGMEIFRKRGKELKLPIMLIHGTSDKMVPIEASRLMNKSASSEELIYKEYEGAFHELLNDGDNTSLQDIVSWLENNL